MKYPLLILLIGMTSTLFSQQVIIFGKEEKCFFDTQNSPCKPEGEDKLAFLDFFQKESFNDPAMLMKASLVSPPEWGKKVSDETVGEIVFPNTSQKGFITDLTLHHLLPGHTYLLTLNGNPKLAGNELLPDPVPNLPEEKYYDFLSITTDQNGEYHAKIGVFLKPGDYYVRLYVKDTEDWKIVLYHDYFKFTVL
jgi:hypothetical protein